MKTKITLVTILFSLLMFFNLLIVHAGTGTNTPQPPATPTVDIFAEPPLPDHPTQLELGAHLFWHHCMPCHGDVGQGLTDAFRYQWEPDHQNCWEPGCHSGRYDYDSFPVPTVVPPLVGVDLTTRHDPEALFTYLKTTHPPQDPGLLGDEEYQALVTFIYHLNDELLPVPAASPTPVPPVTPVPSLTPSSTSLSSMRFTSTRIPASVLLLLSGLILLAVISFAYIARKRP